MNKTTRFKSLLRSPELEFICEAHSGLSAKIVEEAGFRGIWGSGLSISAAMGVRDNNEASWTQVLEILEFMSDNTTIPILLDGDTGYGNFNNMRRLVAKLEQRGIAAVCIEDKVFPKTNSFIKGEAQPLADPEEFCGKIKAGKDAQRDDDFCIVARTEALIAGWGLAEALKRAEAYRQAGADAILCHSKLAKPDEILAFMKEWAGRLPVVIVPTMYWATPTQAFRDAGVSMVIWANHILRASIKAMQETAVHLVQRESLAAIENDLPAVKEIFRLQGMDEYDRWEEAYLPKSTRGKAILLAASKGSLFGKLTDDKPKCMLEVEGRPVIAQQIEIVRRAGVKDITVVTGYRPEAFTVPGVQKVHNDRWESTGEVGSLLAARKELDGHVLVGYGDVVTRQFVVSQLCASTADFSVVIDFASHAHKARKDVDYARVTPPRVEGIKEIDYQLQRIDAKLDPSQASGEWTGLLFMTDAGTRALKTVLAGLESKGVQVATWSMPQLLNHLVESGHTVHVHYIHDNWMDVDDILDLSDLYKF
jgi:phosphoenolpyruvate phosphomutase